MASALMPVRVDAREIWVVGVTLEMLTMQWERPLARVPASEAFEEDLGAQLYSAFQLAHFEADELDPFVAERVWLDPPARNAKDVYERTNTGFGSTRRQTQEAHRAEQQQQAQARASLPHDRVLEWHPFVRLVDAPPGRPSRWIRLDAHLDKVFVDVAA